LVIVGLRLAVLLLFVHSGGGTPTVPQVLGMVVSVATRID